MKLENKINRLISNLPIVKKIFKRAYQLMNYIISDRKKVEGDILMLSPEKKDGFEYFFGYYDKTPWDIHDQYVLCLRVKSTTKELDSNETAEIVLIDTKNKNNMTVINKSNAWNVQQGCMLQWYGPEFKDEILFNDYRNDSLVTIIYNIVTKEEKIFNLPSYSVSTSGDFGITLDFERLHAFRPGYGYKTNNSNDFLNTQSCIWKIDYKKNKVLNLLDFETLINFKFKPSMKNATHKVNHIMLSPNNDKFMFLHRWIINGKKFTRLLTFDLITNKIKIINDDDMISHCCWKDNDTIMGYMNKKGLGEGYYLINENNLECRKVIDEITVDGHPSYSPVNDQFITDTYPNRERKSSLYLVSGNEEINLLAKVYAPFKYDNEFRCDLHPRWNRYGNKVAFDSTHSGKRGLYYINL